ncbi:MAG: NTP transferase domain-containing protein [Armatimonadetes bacterium]|nr:NTP transferase domain-containing protein [Armatimonadota bacterium]
MSKQSPGRFAAIAAAGKGTRFTVTEYPKVLAPLGGRPCLQWVLDAIDAGLGEHQQILVVGHAEGRVRAAIGPAPHRMYRTQVRQEGTGHALLTALEAIPPGADGDLYFFCGDKPKLRPDTVARFREQFERDRPGMLFLTAWLDGNDAEVAASRQGRVVSTDYHGRRLALGILERKVIEGLADGCSFRLPDGSHRYFSRAELLAIREVNVSTYAWPLQVLRPLARHLSKDNSQREYMVTDLVKICLEAGHTVQALPLSDPAEGKGIDTPEQWEELSLA